MNRFTIFHTGQTFSFITQPGFMPTFNAILINGPQSNDERCKPVTTGAAIHYGDNYLRLDVTKAGVFPVKNGVTFKKSRVTF